LTLAIALTLYSCDRLKRKGHQGIDKTKEVISDTKQKVSQKATEFIDDKILNSAIDTPNTERDRKRFREYLLTEIPDDVKNINSYADFLGADYKILISFTCNKSTIEKIVAAKKMESTTTKNDGGLFFGEEFLWWDKDKIKLLDPYKVGKDHEYWKYLWFDPKTKQAYYEEFSL